MRFMLSLQVVDAVTNEGVEADLEEVAELIEAAVSDVGPVRVLSNAVSRLVTFVCIKIAAEAAGKDK